MRRQRKKMQGVLFEPDCPRPPATGEQREHLIRLLSALVLEVMTNTDPLQTGDEHDSDHA